MLKNQIINKNRKNNKFHKPKTDVAKNITKLQQEVDEVRLGDLLLKKDIEMLNRRTMQLVSMMEKLDIQLNGYDGGKY